MKQPLVSMIMAHDSTMGIGYDNKLPWVHCKPDMVFFQKHTKGKVVVMGRKTWDSLPVKPLPGRDNVVLTSKNDSLEGVESFTSMESILEAYKYHPEIVVIGGALTYRYTRKFIDRAYITLIHSCNEADLMVEGNWDKWARTFYDGFTSDECTMCIYERGDIGPELDIYFSAGLKKEQVA